jgi:hypothetical protein
MMAVLALVAIAQAAAPTLEPAFHLDRSRQVAFEAHLTGTLTPATGSTWTGQPITVVFPAPLGYVAARSWPVREFPDQRVRRISVQINNQEITYIDAPTPTDTRFWTLNTEKHRGSDCVAIRFTPAVTGDPITINVSLYSTLIHSVLSQGAPSKDREYKRKVPDPARKYYLELAEDEYTLDPLRWRDELNQVGLISPTQTITESLQKLTQYFLQSTKYDPDFGEPTTDMHAFLGSSEKRIGNCHALNTPALFMLRGQGIPVGKVSGRYLETGKAHVLCHVYDDTLEDSYLLDFAAISAYGSSGKESAFDLLAQARPENLLLFEDDATNFFRSRIPGLPNEALEESGVKGASNCGDWVLFSGGRFLGALHPDIDFDLTKTEILTQSDPRFVVFTSSGPQFTGGL